MSEHGGGGYGSGYGNKPFDVAFFVFGFSHYIGMVVTDKGKRSDFIFRIIREKVEGIFLLAAQRVFTPNQVSETGGEQVLQDRGSCASPEVYRKLCAFYSLTV